MTLKHITTLILTIGMCFTFHTDAQNLQYRPGQEFRSLNTGSYQIAIQKNGRLDVALTSNIPIFLNAFPMFWEEGEDEPEIFKTDGRFSQRYKVEDPLGEGHGMMIKIEDLEWSIRAYPSKPYMAVQVAYLNNGKKPVTIKALYPWCIGDPKDGVITLGDGTTQAKILSDFIGPHPYLATGPGAPSSSLALVNMLNNRSIITGFFTGNTAATSVSINRDENQKEDIYNWFQAKCEFDPPITIQPGERLDSEVLYIALTESNPIRGIERMAKALQVVNELPTKNTPPSHGWYMSKESGSLNERSVLNMLGFMDANLKQFGWTHLIIGRGWDDGTGAWLPDVNAFPKGLQPITEYAHQLGLTVGLEITPFTVPALTSWQNAHSEWVTPPAQDIQNAIGTDTYILDVTQPIVQEHLQNLGQRIGIDWGIDAVHGINASDAAWASTFFNNSVSRNEAIEVALYAFRSGLGQNVLVWQDSEGATPFAEVAGYSYLAQPPTGWPYRPLQQQESVVAQATQAARQSLSNPHIGIPQYTFLNDDRFSITQQRAWITALALSGSSIQIATPLDKIQNPSMDMLTRVLPLPERPAKPMDLFHNSRPRIWYLPINTPFGQWNIVALFNWNSARPQDINVPFVPLQLQSGAFYTVYDFWSDTYFGIAREGIKITVPPSSVRLIGLRPLENRPMVIALNRHILMGTNEIQDIKWDASELTLQGTFNSIAHTDYGLNVLVPEDYKADAVGTSEGPPQWKMDKKNILKMEIRTDKDVPIDWEIRFSRTNP